MEQFLYKFLDAITKENIKSNTVLFLIILPFLSFITLVQGQQIEITGTVLDAYDNTAISNVQVVLMKKSDSTIVAFTVTSVNGTFQLNKKIEQTPKDYYLRVAHIGYVEAIFTKLNEGLNRLDIKLEPKNFELPEINISIERPIRKNGDTTSFQVDFYNKRGEQNIEDLLKNMPNFKVEEDGSIYFKNNRISKIFIEGDNLSGNNYQVVTRSLDPSVLNEIQVLERFSENKLLTDFDNQKESVLNITIKEERKKLVFGNAHIKAGNQYDGLVSLLSILNKSKQLLVVSANDVGVKRSLLSRQKITEDIDRKIFQAPSLHDFKNLYIKQLNSNIENINQEKVLRYALAKNVHPKFKLNFDIDAYKDTRDNFRRENSTFFTQNSFSIVQTDTLQNNSSKVMLDFKIEYLPTPKTRMYFTSEALSEKDALTQHSLFSNENINSKALYQGYSIYNKGIINHVEITHKISDYQALHMDLDQSSSSNMDYYETRNLMPSLWYFATGNMDDLPSIFNQSIKSDRHSIRNQVKWYYKKNNIKIQTGASFLQMSNQYNLSNHYTQYKLNNINRDIRFNQVASYLSKHLEATFSFDIPHITQNIFDNKSVSKNLILPSIMVNYKLPSVKNITQTIVGSVSKDYRRSTDWALIDSPLFLDFRTSKIGNNNNLLIDKNISGSLSYIYFDIFRYLTFNVNLFVNKSDNWNFSNYIFQSDFSWSELLNLKNLGSEGANIKVEKTLYSIRGNVKLEFEAILNRFQNIVNQQERDINNRILSSSILYRSAFNFPLNIECSYYILHNKYFFFTNNIFASENFFYNTKLKTTLFFNNSRISGRFSGDLTTIAQNRIWLFNGQVEYKLKNNLKISLTSFNGLNKKSYNLLDINTTSRISTEYALLGRCILVGLQSNF